MTSNSLIALFISIRKEIERESGLVEEHHLVQFLYLISWFLNAELERQRKTPNEELGFGLIAGVLDHQSLITITKLMRQASENRQMTKLAYAMNAFKTVVLVASEMSASNIEADRDIAENMVSRLFYEETTLEMISRLPNVIRKAHMLLQQGCCDLIYVVLKILETFSKQGKLFVKQKKRRRRSKANRQFTDTSSRKRKHGSEDDDEDSEIDEHPADKLARSTAASERAFEFARFESRFLTQNCVDMFCQVLSNYAELSDSQIKRVISFFHRVFFKDEQEILLFRLDFVNLLYKCLDPKRGIPASRSSREDVEQFMKHFTRRLIRNLKERPAYFVEILFTKMVGSLHFLKYGYDDVSKKKKQARKPLAPDYDEMEDIYQDILNQHAQEQSKPTDDGVVANALAEKKQAARLAAEAEMADFIDDEDNISLGSVGQTSHAVEDHHDQMPTAEELEAMMEEEAEAEAEVGKADRDHEEDYDVTATNKSAPLQPIENMDSAASEKRLDKAIYKTGSGNFMHDTLSENLSKTTKV